MKVNGLSSKMIVLVLLLAIAPQAQGHHMLAGGDHYPEAIEVTLDPPVVDMGRFTENLGQWEPHVTFVARCSFGDAVFGTDGVMYDVRTAGGGHRVKVAFDSGAPVDPAGVGDLGSSTSYFLGNAPDGWVSDARSFRQILYTDVWPGINVRYYFHDGALKYDVIVSADADPSPVRFTVEGHNGLDVGADVLDIRLSTDVRLQDRDLVAWYSDDGEAVPARFTDDDRDGGYGFSLDKEPGRELVIDPLVILASTFLGGTYADTAEDMVMDDEGNVYIAGTNSDNA